jgi:hypothetical protein
VPPRASSDFYPSVQTSFLYICSVHSLDIYSERQSLPHLKV